MFVGILNGVVLSNILDKNWVFLSSMFDRMADERFTRCPPLDMERGLYVFEDVRLV